MHSQLFLLYLIALVKKISISFILFVYLQFRMNMIGNDSDHELNFDGK